MKDTKLSYVRTESSDLIIAETDVGYYTLTPTDKEGISVPASKEAAERFLAGIDNYDGFYHAGVNIWADVRETVCELDERKWYAVQKDSTDDWSHGSFDQDEATDMMMQDGYKQIAVIINGVCEKVITREDVDVRLWKVYSTAYRSAHPVKDVTGSERNEINAAANSIEDEIFSSGKLTSSDEDVDENDDFYQKVINRIYDTVINTLDNGDQVDCGDYMLVRSYKEPDRPYSCGWLQVDFSDLKEEG